MTGDKIPGSVVEGGWVSLGGVDRRGMNETSCGEGINSPSKIAGRETKGQVGCGCKSGVEKERKQIISLHTVGQKQASSKYLTSGF